jgi:predicted dehydrogenase
MAIELTSEQRDTGKKNFQRLVGHHGLTRREFMQGMLAAGAVVPISAAAYFGYTAFQGKPVKVALIGTGDEGGVLVGEHNPDFLEIVAVCDIRPTNMTRIFKGESSGYRKGLERIYGKGIDKKIKTTADYREILAMSYDEVQAVIIALPLHLHAPVALAAMDAGKHVLCEKLMAWNIDQCKKMIRMADKKDRILSVGHQRHYSMLYAYASEIVQSGEVGDIRHIRAFWHRNNVRPRLDDEGKQLEEEAVDIRTGEKIAGKKYPMYHDSWRLPVPDQDRAAVAGKVKQYGYHSVEELVRWRLYQETGGGLMAELGSHQLDACSIFLNKVKPLAVSATGGKYFYRDDREAEDHVFCTFEFPGPRYWADDAHTQVKDAEDKVIVTYSSISTNNYEPYGECVMGSKGTLLVEQEEQIMFFPAAGRSTTVTASAAGKTAADSSATWAPGAAKEREQAGKAAMGGPVSRGYREEMEHFAFCVKMWDEKNVAKTDRPKPRCDGRVAMGDAIVALTANVAMRGTKATNRQPQRIVFQEDWFKSEHDAVPDAENMARKLG